MKRFYVVAIVVGLFMGFSFRCTSSVAPVAPPAQKTITINQVIYMVSNIDPVFGGVDLGVSAYCGIWVYWNETGITFADLDSGVVSLPGNRTWSLYDSTIFFESSKCIGGYYFYNLDTPNDLPVGTYTARLKLKNGSVSNYQFTVGRPGNKTVDTAQYFYTEEYLASNPQPPAKYVPAILRAKNISGTIDSTNKTVKVSFVAPAQEEIYSGALYFYDVNGLYVGNTNDNFRNSSSGNINTWLNNGQNFFKDGSTKNSVNLTQSDIYLWTGKVFSDIKKVSVFLCDGNQYVADGHYSWCDYRSIAKLVDLQIQ